MRVVTLRYFTGGLQLRQPVLSVLPSASKAFVSQLPDAQLSVNA